MQKALANASRNAWPIHGKQWKNLFFFFFFNFQFKSALISFLVCYKSDLFVLITWAAPAASAAADPWLRSMTVIHHLYPPVKSHRKSTFLQMTLPKRWVKHYYAMTVWLGSVWDHSSSWTRQKGRETADGQISCRNAQKGLRWALKHRQGRRIITTRTHMFDTEEKKTGETNRDVWESIRTSSAHSNPERGWWRREIVQGEQGGCWLSEAETAS